MPELDELTQSQRAMWGAGDDTDLSRLIEQVGGLVVARAGVEDGMTLLDVACGPGNAALPAARAGAHVTGLDLTPSRRRARPGGGRGPPDRAGRGERRTPFADARFDRVVSTLGPRRRTCPRRPTTPGRRSSGGREGHVREMFGAVSTDIAFERQSATIVWDSAEGLADYFMDRFGPMVTARQALGERFAELRARIVDIWKDAKTAEDGTLHLPQEYLLSLVRL